LPEIRWLEDDCEARFVPLPPNHPSGLIGYLEMRARNPEPWDCARIIDLKDPYED